LYPLVDRIFTGGQNRIQLSIRIIVNGNALGQDFYIIEVVILARDHRTGWWWGRRGGGGVWPPPEELLLSKMHPDIATDRTTVRPRRSAGCWSVRLLPGR